MTLAIQDVGLLSGSSTPPLGEGVAPISGTGGDGSPSVAGKGIAAGGPGAVRWYGGQWLIPYSGRPGSTVQNVSCDVIANAQSTDLLELVGNAGVIGSVQGQAQNGTFRLWITQDTPGAHLPYAIGDGEVLALRHSPRDVATGGWTTGVEQMTITGCAARATRTVVVPVLAPIVDSPHAQLFATVSGLGSGAKILYSALPTSPGAMLDALRVRVQDDGAGARVQAMILSAADGSESLTPLAQSPLSAGLGIEETISIQHAGIAFASGTQYYVSVLNTSGGLTSSARVYRIEADLD